MKKVLVNGYFGLNFGDDLFFKILFDRYPQTHFYFYNNYYNKPCYEPYKNVVFKNQANADIRWYPRIRKYFDQFKMLPVINHLQFSQYDATVFIGGSIFMEKSNVGRNGREKRSIFEYFFKHDKPAFVLGSNFGPYQTEGFKAEYEQIFKQCADVCFREQYSYDLFNHLESVRMNPDIVFSYKASSVDKVKHSVGISIMDLTHKPELKAYTEAYELKMKELIERLVTEGKKITLFSFSEVEGDLAAIQRILANVTSKEAIQICSYTGHIDEFLEVFAAQEKMIACRFHSLILSQVFNQDVYPFVYSKKTLNVLKDTNLDAHYSTIEDIAQLDIEKVLEVVKDNKLTNHQIFAAADQQFAKLDAFLK